MSERRGGSRWAALAAATAAGLALGAAGVWAISTVIVPPTDPLEDAPHTLVSVQTGDVGSSLNVNATASWSLSEAGRNQAAGVVTDILVTDGAEVQQGGPLYAVNLRPVTAAAGQTPAFRELAPGTEGPDVRQLQTMLSDLGYYGGAVDGKLGTGTERALRAWQKAVGYPVTGIVSVGDIIFVPELPSRVVIDSKLVQRGSVLSGGENVLSTLSPAPTFALPITAAQADLVPDGTRVELTAPDGLTWTGQAQGRRSDPAQPDTVTVLLASADDSPICAEACASLSATEQSILPARVVTVPAAEGLTVPTSALSTQPDGSTQLVLDTGQHVTVTVLSAARGVSLIEGVAEGTLVRLPTVED